jgi:hypothetical protein
MEQIAVYGSLLVGLLFWAWARPRFTTVSVLIFVLLVVELLVALLGTVLPVTNRSSFGPGRTLAGLDNLLLPIAALVVGLMLVGLAADTTRLIRIVCRILVVAMAINAVIAYFSSIYDLTGLLSPFWAPPDSRMTVATLSAQTGRFSGVLNQPAEAGTLYGVGVLAAIHLYRGQMLKMGVSMLLLTIGGVLTVSKVFLLVGFPIAVWQAIRASGLRLRGLTVLFLLTAVAAAVAVRFELVSSWVGGAMFSRLLHPSGGAAGAVDVYTAGRLGSSSTLQPVAEAVLKSSPWYGFGAGGLATPYDNGWVEALVVAGVAGAIIYTAVLVTLAVTWARRRRSVDRAQSAFAGGLVLILIGASVGLPALTANRVATVAWLLICLLLLSPAQNPVPLEVTRRRIWERMPARPVTHHHRAPVGQGSGRWGSFFATRPGTDRSR